MDLSLYENREPDEIQWLYDNGFNPNKCINLEGIDTIEYSKVVPTMDGKSRVIITIDFRDNARNYHGLHHIGATPLVLQTRTIDDKTFELLEMPPIRKKGLLFLFIGRICDKTFINFINDYNEYAKNELNDERCMILSK